MNQGTILGSQIGRWIILAAVVAVLGALLLTIRPLGAQEAPPVIPGAETVFNYAEDDTGPVTTYRARDPEGNKIFWTLSGTDAGVFSIDGGALRFKSQPDYENPRDGVNAGSTPPAIAGNNIYRVTVRFGAGGQDGTPATDHYDGDDLGELDLVITVTNEDEPGRVYISSLQPQVGTQLTATVTDLDGVAVPGSWQWASSDSDNGPFTNIPARSTDNTYRPVDADLGKYLQVTARYRDNVSGADVRELSEVSANPVRKDIVTSNSAPKFPDQSTLGLTGAPARTETERFVHENSPAGTRVGAPVTAFDDATDIEVLTYSLSGASGDVDNFNIDPVTGQITVAAGARLNADVVDGTRGAADTPYEVSVIATDGDGDIQTIEVDIRVVGVNEPPSIGADSDATPPVVAAREMSHYESDRTARSATTIDIDLDTGVLYTTATPPVYTPDTVNDSNLDAATYAAMDAEDEPTTLTWSLAGADGDLFTLDANADEEGLQSVGATATLAFKAGPDYEDPKDADKDNVHEVTLVVTDSVGATGEYPVTVKVINSTDDNKPGTVKILNRVPEVAIPLKASFSDPDGGVRELKWQWYRSVATSSANDITECPTGTDGPRYFIDDFPTTDPATWVAIPGATSDTYTPGYDEDSGGSSNVTTDSETQRVVTWMGGDVDVTITTTKATETQPESTAYAWENFKCLRAAVTYRDGIDRTHTEQDNPDTGVDETLETAFVGSEHYVKRIDERNDAPVFTEDGTATSPAVSSYTAERREDAVGATLDITEAFAATDVPTDEDDDPNNPANSPTDEDPNVRNSLGPGPGDDVLTYSLSGADAKYFVIVGSVEHPTSYDPDGDGTATAITDAGSLVFKVDDDLTPLDFEMKTRYTVTISATDPSGDDDSVTVTINITDHNEMPDWVKGTSPAMVVYAENGTADLATYLADDPEGAGITYALVAAADTTVVPQIDAADVGADHARFSIDSLDGSLSFKSSPNYEMPGDADPDNRYQVTVRATVVDNPPLTSSSDPAGPHAITRAVTVVVTNVNEAPEFSETTDTLEIKENPDDPQKEPTATRGALYLLNRGVGKPSANLPIAPNLDVGIPVSASDGDNTATFPIGGYAETPAVRDRVDGLTYTLSGTDAAHFHIVPATGQILTLEKLDYESKNEYNVTVKATDPMGLSGTIDMTIEVLDVDEVPINPNLVLSGLDAASYSEDDTGAVGTYNVTGDDGNTVTWSLSGDDMGQFSLAGSGTSRMLQFASAPDYENAADADGDNEYMVTVSAEAGGDTDTVDVTVTVTNAEEPGTVTLDPMHPSVGTAVSATLADADEAVAGTVNWVWATADAMDGNYTTVSTASAATASYTPVADDVGMYLRATATYTDGFDAGNEVMAVSASAVSQLVVAGDTAPSVAENVATVGTYTASGSGASSVTWSLSGADAGQFGITGGVLSFNTAPDFENPADTGGDNVYNVTVEANDGNTTADLDVAITVTDVTEERPMAVQDYDTNGTSGIQIDELFRAIDDYFEGGIITIAELFEVIDAYFE